MKEVTPRTTTVVIVSMGITVSLAVLYYYDQSRREENRKIEMQKLLKSALFNHTSKVAFEFLDCKSLGRLACCDKDFHREIMHAPCFAWVLIYKRYTLAPFKITGVNKNGVVKDLIHTEMKSVPGMSKRLRWKEWICLLKQKFKKMNSANTPGHFLEKLVAGTLNGPIVEYKSPSPLVTPIWYRAIKEEQYRWQWSPNCSASSSTLWIPVESNIVPSGPWKGMKPVHENLVIIEFLNHVCPPPPPIPLSPRREVPFSQEADLIEARCARERELINRLLSGLAQIAVRR